MTSITSIAPMTNMVSRLRFAVANKTHRKAVRIRFSTSATIAHSHAHRKSRTRILGCTRAAHRGYRCATLITQPCAAFANPPFRKRGMTHLMRDVVSSREKRRYDEVRPASARCVSMTFARGRATRSPLVRIGRLVRKKYRNVNSVR